MYEDNGGLKFVGHSYLIRCYDCGIERVIREDTFLKMREKNLIELVGRD